MNQKIIKFATAFFVAMFLSSAAYSQVVDNATPSQRIDIMNQKLGTMRDSLKSTISVLKKEKREGDDEKNPGTPLGRLVSLEKDASKYTSELNTLRGKISRAEKFEIGDLDRLEEDVARFQSNVDKALLETAEFRAKDGSTEGLSREKKKKKKFLGIFGGGTDEYEELIGTVAPGRDRELFIVATREIRKKNYETGRLLFQTIISTYPDSPYLPMSKLAVADSFFLEGSTSALIQAAANYQDWLTFFPTHPLADRVLLKIAECEMRQIGLPDRDITRAKKAEQRLQALIQRYPDSNLRPLVEERLRQVQDNLGLHDLYVGNFYYKKSVNYEKGGLKGAQQRYLEIIEKYSNFAYLDEALYKLAVTYMVEEETDQAARYFQRLVREFPNSDRVNDAKKQLELIGAKIPEPDPERLKVMPPNDDGFFENFKNQFLGTYPMTIDKNGVLMTKDFDKTKFELIDQIIENQGDLKGSQIPKALTTVISDKPKGGE
ncbi:MAG: outer membrane protein assembly factor BamD [Pyrinomonadaceae bacterium]